MNISLEILKQFGMQDFLCNTFACTCGKKHSVNIEKVIIENGAVNKIPELLKQYNYSKVFLVADTHTYKAAGALTEHMLKQNSVEFTSLVYEREKGLVPDEEALGEFIISIPPGTEAIIAVGTGVINDLCKYMSFKLGIPYMVVATAPSMDGYASDGSALIIKNLKTTLSTTVPRVIIGDVDILKNSPSTMIAAGFGDMIGKYSALNDWKLSSIINNEYYCDVTAQIVRNSLDKCMENAEGIKKRKDESIKILMEGLVITGIAMSFVRNSRPASGSEHHLAHFWEMMFLFAGREAVLHGIKVGINTIATSKLREALASEILDFDKIQKHADVFNENEWMQDVQRIYQNAAGGIIALNSKEQINSKEKRLDRIIKIRNNWEAIITVLKEVPKAEEIEKILAGIGAAISPAEVGIEKTTVKKGMVYAKEVRARYTILQLLWDIGLLNDYAVIIENYFFDSKEK